MAVEPVADLAWQVAKDCSGAGCIAVASLAHGGVAIRDTKDPESPVLHYTSDEWTVFLAAVKQGEFDALGAP